MQTKLLTLGLLIVKQVNDRLSRVCEEHPCCLSSLIAENQSQRGHPPAVRHTCHSSRWATSDHQTESRSRAVAAK